jgi:hypothetical protein
MSGLINFIKSIFGGIFGLFSKKEESSTATPKSKAKKSSGYFLEAEDAAGTGVQPAAAVAVAAPPATKKAAPTKPAAPAKAPEPVAAANPLNLPKPTVTTFAPDYLMPASTNGRRRPGANMASFLTMAKQVKVPN